MRDNIGLYNANAYQKFVGDVNKDNKISVKDAVIVQRCLVGSGNTYSVGAEAEVSASAEPVILPQQSEQPTEKPTQPNTNTVRFTDSKSWGNIYIYAWNSSTGAKNAAWPGVAMQYDSVNSYGQKIYKTDISSQYDKVIFTTAGGSPQTQDILFDSSANGYYVTDSTAVNSTGITVYIAQSW